MTKRLLDFLDEFSRTGGTLWYPPTAVQQDEIADFQDEVEELRELEAQGFIRIRFEHPESRSGERMINQVQIEMLDAEGWLKARRKV